MSISANPLIHENPADTLAASRDYLAELCAAEANDVDQPRGRVLRLLVLLNALEAAAEKKASHE